MQGALQTRRCAKHKAGAMTMSDLALAFIAGGAALMYVGVAYEQWKIKYNQKKKRDEGDY